MNEDQRIQEEESETLIETLKFWGKYLVLYLAINGLLVLSIYLIGISGVIDGL